MVALADDWRLTEQQALYFLTPSRILARYRLIFGDELPDATLEQMVALIVECDSLSDTLSWQSSE